jgi:hypothetical protein
MSPPGAAVSYTFAYTAAYPSPAVAEVSSVYPAAAYAALMGVVAVLVLTLEVRIWRISAPSMLP